MSFESGSLGKKASLTPQEAANIISSYSNIPKEQIESVLSKTQLEQFISAQEVITEERRKALEVNPFGNSKIAQ